MHPQAPYAKANVSPELQAQADAACTEAVFRATRAGHSFVDLPKLLGLSLPYMYSLVVAASGSEEGDAPLPKSVSRKGGVDRAAFQQLLNAGACDTEICAALGCGRRSVQRIRAEEFGVRYGKEAGGDEIEASP